MSKKYKFNPDWTISPGKMLLLHVCEMSEEKVITTEEALNILNSFRDIVSNEVPVTKHVAEALAETTGFTNPQLWLNLQKMHDDFIQYGHEVLEATD